MRKVLIPWLFIIPYISVYILLVVALPASVITVLFHMTDWSGMGTAEFVGLDNFVRLVEDPNYLRALGNNIKWMAFFLDYSVWIYRSLPRFFCHRSRRGGFYLSPVDLYSLYPTQCCNGEYLAQFA